MEFHPYEPKPKTKIEKAIHRRRKLKREYDDWILGSQIYDKKRESSITLGVVPGVVVEERRLKQMLYELARQRHEFNAKHIYNKKRFLDKQMKKSDDLKKALQHESLARGWSVGERDISIDDSSEGLSVEHGYVPKNSEKDIMSKTRVNLLDKKKGINPNGDFQWLTLPPIESKPNSRGTYIKTVKFDAALTRRSPQLSAHGSQPTSRVPTFDRYPSIYRERSKSLPPMSLIPWSQMKSTNMQPGTCLPPVRKDTRFVQLESLLHPSYYGSKRLKSVDVQELVENCNSLSILATNDKQSKKDMEKQIRKFLIKMGIVTA